MKQRILFVCIENSARSQMAAALLNARCRDHFEAESAGLSPGRLNPLAIEIMRELGLDISSNKPRSVDDVLSTGKEFDYVVTVCDEGSAASCPNFPGGGEKLHWGFPDPSKFAGSREERLARTRAVRDLIRAKIESWCQERCLSPV